MAAPCRRNAHQLGPIRFRAALTSESAVKTVALGEAPVSDVAEIRFAIEKIRYSRSDTTLQDR